MGALVTLDLSADSPVRAMPWIITFGPLTDEDEWEPVVCGPYERPHALALAEAVVADEELMAVVEPLLPHLSADEIRGEIAAAKLAVADQEARTVPDEAAADLELAGLTELAEPDHEHVEPTVEEVRAGLARIAARLASAGAR